MNRKAQTSMEFVILTGFMIMTFLVFYIVIQAKLVDANRDKTDQAAKQVENLVVNEIKLAESVTDGYYRQFELPQSINGANYSIDIIPGAGNTPEIVIRYAGRERVYFVQQGYVKGSSTVGKGMNNVTKNGGNITMQKITS
jgi:hypothetical protein